MSHKDLSIKVFKQRCVQELSLWLQQHGWMLSLLTFEDRLMWLQCTKSGRRLESEIRGMHDVRNACIVLMDAVRREEEHAVKTAA